jgi:hypothetical protein
VAFSINLQIIPTIHKRIRLRSAGFEPAQLDSFWVLNSSDTNIAFFEMDINGIDKWN